MNRFSPSTILRRAGRRRLAMLALCLATGLASTAAQALDMGFSGSDEGDAGGFPESPPADINVIVSISGAGTVTSDPPGIACPGVCEHSFPFGMRVELKPSAAAGKQLHVWTGNPECPLFLTGERSSAYACKAWFTTLLPPYPTGSGWTQIGDALTTGGAVGPAPSLALDGDHPVVAHVEAIGGDIARLFVKRLEGSGFVALGGGALNGGSVTAASEPSLVTSPGGLPYYVAWIQGDGVQQNLFVASFDGSVWATVGEPGIPLNVVPGSRAASPSLGLTADGRPVVAWVEDGSVKLKMFADRSWVAAGSADGPPSANANSVRLRVAGFDLARMAWREASEVGSAQLKEAEVFVGGSGSAFVARGTQVNAAGSAVPFFDQIVGDVLVYSETVTPFTLRDLDWYAGFWRDYSFAPIVADSPDRLLAIVGARTDLAIAYSAFSPSADSAQVGVSFVDGSVTPPVIWTALTPLTTTRAARIENLSMDTVTLTSPVVAGVQRDEINYFEARVWRLFPPRSSP